MPEPKIYAIDGVVPVIHPSSFIDESATIIGDVMIGPDCYVGPNVSLRGDMAAIEVGAGSNIQDNCTLHCMPGIPTIVGEWGHLGHGAVVHSARLEKNVLVGMNAVVMDRAFVGENSVVAAMAFVKVGMQVPENSLVAGTPARIIRQLTEQEIEGKRAGTRCYHQLISRCKDSLRRVTPLTEKETGRPALRVEALG